MSVAKRARMNPPAFDRVKIVTKDLLFHEAMDLVKSHHAGHLKSYEADAKEAARARLYRAFAIIKDVDMPNYALLQNDGWTEAYLMERIKIQRVAELEGFRQIKEFAPELVAAGECCDWYSLCSYVEREYDADVLFMASPRVRHTHARDRATSVESCVFDRDDDGTPWTSEEAHAAMCRYAIKDIRVYAPELVLGEDGMDIAYSMQRVIMKTAWVCE